jgi:ubiquinone/menaquinone biosynthesis C-methylase UbiE
MRNLSNLEIDFLGSEKKVLLATSVLAFKNSLLIDSFLGALLASHNCSVGVAICDEALDACLNSKISSINSDNELINGDWKKTKSACSRCNENRKVFDGTNIIQFNFSEFLLHAEVDELVKKIEFVEESALVDFKVRDVGLYEHAFAATARFYAKGLPHEEANYLQVLKKYMLAAAKSVIVFESIIVNFKPDLIIAHHGIYVPQGLAVEVAKKHGVRVITWTPSYRKGTFIFCDGDTYHKVMPKKPFVMHQLSQKDIKKTIEYLDSRQSAKNDWIWFNAESKNKFSFRERYKIANSRKIVTVFTNVFWDAQIHFSECIFDNMLSWVKHTIMLFEKMEDVHLVIRAHPAEYSGFVPSRQPLDQLIKDFKKSPNLTIISGDDPENSYSLADESHFCIIYASKIAGELAARGSKVVVVGDAWARGKGFTYDPLNLQDYELMVIKLCRESSALDPSLKDRALVYCHDFFFEDMTIIELAVPTGEKVQPFDIAINNKAELISGSYPGILRILDILIGGGKLTKDLVSIMDKRELSSTSIFPRALKHKSDIDYASDTVKMLGLDSHHDSQKNWDTLLAYYYILSNKGSSVTVLDAGSGAKPVILKWLRKSLPASELYACDREQKSLAAFEQSKIKFSLQDMSSTDYPSDFFDFITSISVIEHGVILKEFLMEMHRILKPGGALLISTDYWETPIDTSQKFPYLTEYGPMKIFNCDEVKSFINNAKETGFEVLGENRSDLVSKEKAVRWDRMDEEYTFAFIPLRKL